MSDPFWGTESEPRIGVDGRAADGLRKRTHSGIATSAGHLRDGCIHPRSRGQRHRLDGLASKHSHTDHATTPTDTRQPPAADVQRRHAAAYARVRVRLVHFGLLDCRPECWHALMCPRYTSPPISLRPASCATHGPNNISVMMCGCRGSLRGPRKYCQPWSIICAHMCNNSRHDAPVFGTQLGDVLRHRIWNQFLRTYMIL